MHISMLMKVGDDVISEDRIPVINGIHSATANMECCSVVITDPAPHHDTPSTPSGQSSHCDNVLDAYATPATDHQLSLN